MLIIIISLVMSIYLQAVIQAVREREAVLWEAAYRTLGSACPTFRSRSPPQPTVIISVVPVEEPTIQVE